MEHKLLLTYVSLEGTWVLEIVVKLNTAVLSKLGTNCSCSPGLLLSI